MIKLQALLEPCGLIEEQFLAGIPAFFDIVTTDIDEPIIHILAHYADGKIHIQSSTFQSLYHDACMSKNIESNYKRPLTNPIIIDLSELDGTLAYIAKNMIMTTLLFQEDINMQIVTTLIFDRYAAKYMLGCSFTSEEDKEKCRKELQEGISQRLLRCTAIDERWKREHLTPIMNHTAAL